MKKVLLLMMAALSIIFTQCKKADVQPTQTGGNTVDITLSVGDGSKLTVNPSDETVSVTFGANDKIYVASEGKYVGTLTHDGTNFKGSITGATEGKNLHFYFLGNKTPSETLSSETSTLTVDISDQSSSLPVISYNKSNETYSSSNKNYSATLKNKCALVKFNVSDYSGSGNMIICNINNKVSVNLDTHVFTPSHEGNIRLNKRTTTKGNEYWAIVLPNATANGVVCSSDNYVGTYSMPAVSANDYVTQGASISGMAESTEHPFVDLGLPSATLWATCNVGAETPQDYGNYYAWGEKTTKTRYNWTTYVWCGGSEKTLKKYCTILEYSYYENYYDDRTVLEMSDDAANVNWGGNWRMPTTGEFNELINNNTFEWLNANATSQNVSSFTASVNGCLVIKGGKNNIALNNSVYMFLPAAGSYSGTTQPSDFNKGYYWSSSLNSSTPSQAFLLYFQYVNSAFWLAPQSHNSSKYARFPGFSVRPVR